MKAAILSDIHDHVWNLQAALRAVQDCDVLLCCGDLCSPFVVDLLAAGFPGKPIHIVFGNNDGDLFRITAKAKDNAHLHLHGELCAIELDGRRLAMNHYPDIARDLAASGLYDVVCYGHNHAGDIRQLEKALMINPGTLMGYDPINKRDITATYAIYDTRAHSAQLHTIHSRTG